MSNTHDTRAFIEKYYTFDDLLLKPNYSDFIPKEASLTTKFTRNITLNNPFISAAMDTVTGAKMAIAMAEFGGVGVLHRNNSIAEQAIRVRRVKRASNYMISDPATAAPDERVEKVNERRLSLRFSGMPVVDENRIVQGIITRRDLEDASTSGQKVEQIMTPKASLVTINIDQATNLKLATELMHKAKVEKLIVVHSDGRLAGLMTMRDIQQTKEHPDINKDSSGRLIVAASIGVGEKGYERAEALIDAGVDVLVVDSAHGHSANVIGILERLKKAYGDRVDLVAGNVATSEGALALIDKGADAIKVGIGPGSICTTRIVTGVGVPQLSALFDVVPVAKKHGIPVISDGGIRYSGDAAKALAAGASSIMLGNILAGTEETPGEIELYQGRRYKSYRGMGSLGAMQKNVENNAKGEAGESTDRYFQEGSTNDKLVPEGIEGRVPYRGTVEEQLFQLRGGIKQTLGYLGSHNIQELWEKARFIEITNSGMAESHVHDVDITRAAPNYQI